MSPACLLPRGTVLMLSDHSSVPRTPAVIVSFDALVSVTLYHAAGLDGIRLFQAPYGSRHTSRSALNIGIRNKRVGVLPQRHQARAGIADPREPALHGKG